MRPYDKQRNSASEALIELRQRLGMSQAEFAVKVLDVAPMTVSRMETTTPPRGEVLLKLAGIAGDAHEKEEAKGKRLALSLLAVRFQALLADELYNSAPANNSAPGKLITEPASADREEHGYLFMKIEGSEGMRAASGFLSLIPALKSKDDKIRDEAIKIADRLIAAVDKMNGNPAATELRDAFHPRPARKKSSKKK